jgi:uncharacterized repeat protein (TIGR01451 family)
MKSFLSSLRKLDSSNDVLRDQKASSRQYQLFTTLLLSSTIIGSFIGLMATPANAAPARKDWCSTIWSTDNAGTATNGTTRIDPITGVTTTTSPATGITMPPFFPGTGSVAGIGIHAESGTLYAFDRSGSTGTLYKYKLGTDTTWQSVSVSGLVGSTGTPSFTGASTNLNKVTVDGNTLYIAESVALAVYSIPLNSSGVVIGSATATQFTFTGDPIGTPPHSAASFRHNIGGGDTTPTDPIGSAIMNGGDIAIDDYGDVYNVTYNTVLTAWNLINNAWTPTTVTNKAYFYKQSGNTWVYQGETPTTATFAGAAFYKGELYVKAATQLRKVPLVRSGGGYTGWSNPLINVGAASASYSSADLAACGTPNITMTKTQQVYADAALTTLVTDQSKIKTGQYIKYTITAQNTGNSWAKSTTVTDSLPTGTTYVPNSASLNGTSFGFTTYPTSGFVINAPGSAVGTIPYSTGVAGSDTATMSFAVQVTALNGPVQNQATVAYLDNAGLLSEPSSCTSPLLNCSITPSVTITSVDFGDAPDGSAGTATGNYKTIASDNGPSHVITPGIKLGATAPDADNGLQQNATANADGADEDAFTSLPNVPTTGAYSLPNVPVTNTTGSTATLHAWVDFNNNGSFEAGEYTSAAVVNNATTANLSWTVPAGTVAGSTYARFRLTTQALTDNTATPAEDERSFGSASDGEGEDYPVSIIESVPATPSICSATGGILGANLFVNNGTFGTGTTTPNTSITLPTGRTNYIFKPYASAAPNDGNYAVVNQMTLSTFTGSWHNTVGHSTGTVDDQMMVVNADAVPGTFYTETLTVLPNQNMVFSSWLMNLVTTPASSYAPIKPNISFVINRIGIDDNNDGTIDEPGEGQTITTSGAVPNTANPTWNNYGAIFNTGAATQIQFRFVNNAPGGNGNDIVLDDLMVAPCTLPSGNISGTLYQDINTNNIYNSGTDAKIPANVAVNLKSSTGTIIATAYTDADGNYIFTNVPTGSDYSIEVALTDTNISSELRATANPSGASTTGIQTGITVTANTTLANQNFGFKTKAKLLMVKRITSIKDADTNATTTFNSFVDDGTTNNVLPGWNVGTGSYLLGALNNGAVKVKPGDEVEYTIYYLNSGDSPISKARVCDRLNKNLAFQAQFSTTTAITQGIEFTKDISTSYPTNTAIDNDAGFYSTSSILPIDCNLTANTTFDINNISNNIVVVDVARIANPSLGIVSDPLTGGQRGYVKFKTKVQQ